MDITIRTREVSGHEAHAALQKAGEFLQMLLHSETMEKHTGSYSIIATASGPFVTGAIGTVVAKTWIGKRADQYIRDCGIQFFPRKKEEAILLGIDLSILIGDRTGQQIKDALRACGFIDRQFGRPISILPHLNRLFTPIIVSDDEQLDVLLNRNLNQSDLWVRW